MGCRDEQGSEALRHHHTFRPWPLPKTTRIGPFGPDGLILAGQDPLTRAGIVVFNLVRISTSPNAVGHLSTLTRGGLQALRRRGDHRRWAGRCTKDWLCEMDMRPGSSWEGVCPRGARIGVLLGPSNRPLDEHSLAGQVAALSGDTTGNCLPHSRRSRRATARHRPAPSTSNSATMTALPTQASER